MTVSEQSTITRYTSTGLTANFSTGFEVFRASEINVYIGDVLQSTALWSYAAGKVVFVAIPPAGSVVSIQRALPLEREISYTNSTNQFLPSVLDADLDQIWRALQDIKTSLSGVLALPISDSSNPVTVLAELRAWLESAKNLAEGTALEQLADIELSINDLDARLTQLAFDLPVRIDAVEADRIAQDTILLNLINALANGATKAYLTYAALDAAKATLPANSFARVTNDPNPNNNWLWQWDGTVLTKSSRDDLAQALAAVDALAVVVSNIFTDNDLSVKFDLYDLETAKKYVFAVVNNTTQQVLFGVHSDGSIVNTLGFFGRQDGTAESFVLDKTGLGLKYKDGRLFVGGFVIDLTSDEFCITNKQGLTALHISNTTGKVTIGDLRVLGLELPDASQTPDAPLGLQALTAVVHIILYGQSLSRSTNLAAPPISTTAVSNVIMLAGGVDKRVNDAGYNKTAFAPMVESVVETPVSGVCKGFARRVIESDGALSVEVLGSTTGDGGESVEALGKGGDGWFESTCQYIKDCYDLAQSQGKSYSVYAHCFMQGEANVLLSTGADYYAKYQRLHQDFVDFITQTTGQNFKPYFVHYQVAGHRRAFSNTMQVAIAQWRASRLLDHTILAVPVYAMPHGSDFLHLTNIGAWLMGEYFSRAIHYTMHARSGKWRPLEPIDVTWTATHIDIKFYVPCKPIVIDTFFCPAAPNSGFDIWEGGTRADIISGVTVTSDDTIRVTLTRAAAANAVISCGRGRSNGSTQGGNNSAVVTNIRDSHGLYDVVTSPTGSTHALHNPCVFFEHSSKFGF